MIQESKESCRDSNEQAKIEYDVAFDQHAES